MDIRSAKFTAAPCPNEAYIGIGPQNRPFGIAVIPIVHSIILGSSWVIILALSGGSGFTNSVYVSISSTILVKMWNYSSITVQMGREGKESGKNCE